MVITLTNQRPLGRVRRAVAACARPAFRGISIVPAARDLVGTGLRWITVDGHGTANPMEYKCRTQHLRVRST